MAENVIPAQGLLDHHQVISFQALQVRPIFQAVCGIGVNHQAYLRKLQAKRFHGGDIVRWLDFNLDSLVSGGKFALHGRDQFF